MKLKSATGDDLAIYRNIAANYFGGWKPIETAPKDGTHVLIRRGDGLPATCYWFDGGWHLSVNQRGEYSAWIWGEPTHWTLLPPNT